MSEICKAIAVGWALSILVLFVLLLFTGCAGTVKAPGAYLPGQQFGGDGEPCMNGSCPVINQPRQWLKPCK